MKRILFLLMLFCVVAEADSFKLRYDSELKKSIWRGIPDSNYVWEGDRLSWERTVKNEDGNDITVKTYRKPIEIIADFKPESKVFGIEGNIERNAVKKFGGALKGFVWLDKVNGGGEVILPFTVPHIFIATGDRLNPELTEIGTDPNSDNYYEIIEGKTRVVVKSFSGIGGAAGAPPTLIAQYKFNEKISGDGAELITNGDFSSWSGDNPVSWAVAGETSPSSHTIDGVDVGAETFTISDDGDLSPWFENGNIFEVTGSTGNNGQWEVSSTSWSSPNFEITVVENITNATVDGTITPHPDPEISQVGTGEVHGGTGTGMCNIYSSDATLIQMIQIVTGVIGRKYKISVTVNTVTVAGLVKLYDNSGLAQYSDVSMTTTGTKSTTFVCTNTNITIAIRSKFFAGDVTFDDVSVKLWEPWAVYDSSGNDYDGLAQQVTDQISVAGKINTAFDFNGSSDFIDIGNISASVKSIAIWVNPDAVNITDYLIDLNGTDYITIINGTVTKNGFGSGAQKIYVDGVIASTVTTNWHLIVLTSTVGFTASDLDIGRVEGSGYFNGLIDNLMLFSVELDSGEVGFLYNGSAGREGWNKTVYRGRYSGFYRQPYRNRYLFEN